MNKLYNIKAIGFDYGGVVSGQPGSVFSKALADLLHAEHSAFKEAWFRNNAAVNVEGISYEVFIKRILKDLGKENYFEKVIGFIDSQPGREINQSIIDLVISLRDANYKVGLLSNNSPEGAAEMRAEGLEECFDAFLVSCEIGHMKPSKEAFQALAKALGVGLHELVYVDDTEESLALANEIGYKPVLFTGYDKILGELHNLGINVQGL